MPTAIVPDVHGQTHLMQGILETIGAIDSSGNRIEGWRLIQLGDIADRRGQEGEAECVELALKWFDEILMGNHEYADFGGTSFGGYERFKIAYNSYVLLKEFELISEAHLAGQFNICTKVGDYLVSHAGMHPSYWPEDLSLDVLVDDLNTKFQAHLRSVCRDGQMVFCAVPRIRGGRGTEGGMLWGHWDDLVAAYDDLKNDNPDAYRLPQIVGHTPGDSVIQIPTHNLIKVDVGAKSGKEIVALITEDEKTWDIVSYKVGK